MSRGSQRPDALQIRMNRDSARSWPLYEAHRKHVTRLVVSATLAPGGRLCILGAGNCNDVDLARLCKRFAEIHLVDIDGRALDRAVRRLERGARRRVRVHAPVDVAGVLEDLANIGESTTDAALRAIVARARAPTPVPDMDPCDVVLSAGVLSQIISSVVLALGPGHPHCLDLLLAARVGHLAGMLRALAPGGRALLVGELVASDTCPSLHSTPHAKLSALADEVVAASNFFTGMSPARIMSDLEHAPALRAATRIQLLDPWLWTFSKGRIYLAYALTFESHAPGALARLVARVTRRRT